MTKYCYPAYVQLDDQRFRERYGLDFEEFAIGQRFKHRPGYTFTQQDNIDDCLDTMNQAMLHFDAHYAAQTQFKKNLMVTTTIVQRLVGMVWKTFNRRKRITKWHYINMLAPVFGGDTLYSESEIVSVESDCKDGECGLVSVVISGFSQSGQKTCEMQCDMKIYKQASLPFEANNY